MTRRFKLGHSVRPCRKTRHRCSELLVSRHWECEPSGLVSSVVLDWGAASRGVPFRWRNEACARLSFAVQRLMGVFLSLNRTRHLFSHSFWLAPHRADLAERFFLSHAAMMRHSQRISEFLMKHSVMTPALLHDVGRVNDPTALYRVPIRCQYRSFA